MLLLGGNPKWYNQFVKLLGSFLELNIDLKYDPAIPLLGIYPREIKIYSHTKTYMHRYTAALFIIIPNWKHPKCPSMGEEINKLWYTQLTKHHEVIKRNEVLTHAMT